MPRTRLAAASVVAILAATTCTTEEAAVPSGEPKERQQRTAGEPDEPSELIYVRGRSLFVYDLESGRRHKVARLPSADVAVSPDGLHYAVVKETSPAGSTPEGFRKPVLRLGSIEGEDARKLGPGRSPLWSPDGKYVAGIAKARDVFSCDARPGDPRRTQTCRATELVVAYQVAAQDAKRQTVLGADRWSLIGWTSDHRILAISLIFNKVVVGYPGSSIDDVQTLGLQPAEVWGISPTEYVVLRVRKRSSFFDYAGRREGSTVDLDGAVLGDGTWAPTGGQVVAVAIRQRPARRPQSQLVIVDVASGAVTNVPGGANAQAAAAWAQDGGSFAYTRVHPQNAGKLQAVLCTVALECRPLFSWSEGISLLALR